MPLHVEESRTSLVSLILYPNERAKLELSELCNIYMETFHPLRMDYKRVYVEHVNTELLDTSPNWAKTFTNLLAWSRKRLKQCTDYLNCYNSIAILGSGKAASAHFYQYYESLKYTECQLIESPNARAIQRQIKIAYDKFFLNVHSQICEKSVSVVVFDLDNTIIDDDLNLLDENFLDILKLFRSKFDFMVLWSHGTSSHVSRVLRVTQPELDRFFDLRISRSIAVDSNFVEDRPKGFGYVFRQLNRTFGVTRIAYSCLVDDLVENCQDDYTFFVQVPSRKPELGYYAFFKERLHEMSREARA